mmetsp:Transcript_62014/g.145469  ORF Transcript_62014/g.145469 Transcript_62014/m.145469 type:complete len:220 (-) Transcript_62014:101-760(-)
MVVLVLEKSCLEAFNAALEGIAFPIHCLHLHPHGPLNVPADPREGQTTFGLPILVVAEGDDARVHENRLLIPRSGIWIVNHHTKIDAHLRCGQAYSITCSIQCIEQVVGQGPQSSVEDLNLLVLLPEGRMRIPHDFKLHATPIEAFWGIRPSSARLLVTIICFIDSLLRAFRTEQLTYEASLKRASAVHLRGISEGCPGCTGDGKYCKDYQRQRCQPQG